MEADEKEAIEVSIQTEKLCMFVVEQYDRMICKLDKLQEQLRESNMLNLEYLSANNS